MRQTRLIPFAPRATLLALAGLLAGATAGIAAISDITGNQAAAPPALTTPTPEAPQAASETTQAVAATEAVTAEPNASTAPAAQAGATPTAQPKWVPALTAAADAPRVAARDNGDEYQLRIPFTNRTIRVTVRTFPDSPSEVGETAPSVIAYFEQKNGNRQLAGASGQVFPSNGGEDDWRPTPAVVAHFERVEANHLAAQKAREAATAAAAAALTPAAPTEMQPVAPTAAAPALAPATPGG